MKKARLLLPDMAGGQELFVVLTICLLRLFKSDIMLILIENISVKK